MSGTYGRSQTPFISGLPSGTRGIFAADWPETSAPINAAIASKGFIQASIQVNITGMAKLRLTLACWNYDRTRGLLEGRIPIDGIELTYLNLPVEETFFRMLRHREFDVAEMSLSSYTLSLFRENPPFIAIPAFPSRFFRHSCIYVHAGSGIREPRDLTGKRVGNPEYQMTAPVWIRGILSDEYGVPVTSPTYLSGGEEEAGRSEKLPLSLPAEIKHGSIPQDKTLARMLEAGEIDALYTARA